MTTIHGSSSEKIPRREKIISLFAADFAADLATGLATEVKTHLFALSLVILGMEAFLFYGAALTGGSAGSAQAGAALAEGAATGGALTGSAVTGSALANAALAAGLHAFPRGSFVLSAMLFFFFFTLLEYIFRPFAGRKAAALIPLIPATLLFFLFRNAGNMPVLAAAVATAAVVRLFLLLVPRREKVLLYGIIIPDAAAAWLYFAGHTLSGRFPTDKLLWIALVILTLSALQALVFERNGTAFPFSFFALLGALLVLLPMSQKPIDWTPVVRTGERVARFVTDAADGATYYLSSFFDAGSYTAGYSSLDVNGGNISRSETTQLLLKTNESPYYLFKDNTTSKDMKMRRTVYLAGGRGADKQQLISFLRFLHDCGVDRDYAALFSQISKMDVEYAYLSTADEIAPVSSLLLTAGNATIENGVGASRHKKGYTISALYLNIDYGSPYLTALFERVTETESDSEVAVSGEAASAYNTAFSYEEACEYMESLYDVDLGTLLTKEEFEAAEDSPSSYTGTDNASDRLAELAVTLTESADNEYDKCKLIESYLRQYTYDTNAVGGYDPRSDLTTSEGMSDIADRFLFETGSGYCVHYTASMVTLLRLAGIPARAVSGYRYVFPFEQEDAYAVSGNCAHVWPEAYLTGVGWVPFEPTAAYRTAAEFTWHRTADPSVAEKYGLSPQLSGLPEDGYGNNDQALESLDPDDPSNGDLAPVDLASGDKDSQDLTIGNPAIRIFRIIWPVILSIAMLLVIFIAGTNAVSKFRYRRGTPEQKLLMDVELIKKRIRRLYGSNFTDRGLMTDYIDLTPETLKPDLRNVFRTYYRVVYGGTQAATVTAEESALAKALREKLQRKNTDSLT